MHEWTAGRSFERTFNVESYCSKKKNHIQTNTDNAEKCKDIGKLLNTSSNVNNCERDGYQWSAQIPKEGVGRVTLEGWEVSNSVSSSSSSSPPSPRGSISWLPAPEFRGRYLRVPVLLPVPLLLLRRQVLKTK